MLRYFSTHTWRFAFVAFFFGSLLLTFSLSAQEKKNPAAVREYNAAAALQNGGLFARASEKWKQYIAKYPKESRLDRAHYYLGICQLQNKKYPESIATFRLVIAKFPKFKTLDGVQYNLGMALYQTAVVSKKPADFKIAATELANVVAKYAQSKYVPRALYYQGESLYSAGDKPAAIAAYKKLIAEHAKSSLVADAYYALGTTQQETGDNAQAVVTYQAFLANPAFAKHTTTNEIRLRLGLSFYDEKKFDEAEKLFAAVAIIDKFPHADFALLRQAQCRLETKKTPEAIVILTGFMQKFTKSPYRNSALLTLGRCQFQLAKFDLAIAPLSEVSKANVPEAAEATYWLGRALLSQKKADQAIAILQPAVQKFKTGDFAPYLQMTRIDALYDLPNRRNETGPLYEAFVKQFPEHPLAPQAYYMTALAALGQADYVKARLHAETFLANQKFAENTLRPAVLYVAAESHLLALGGEDKAASITKALQLYQQLVAKFPKHERVPRSHVRIGWCQYQAKQYDQAVQSLNGVLAQLKEPTHLAEARLLIGRSHSAAGRETEAVAAYTAALQPKADWSRGDEVLIAAAQSLRTLKNLDGATQRLKQLETSFPKSEFLAQAAYQQGEIAQEQKKYDQAIAHFQRVLQQHAKSEFAAAAAYGQGAARFAKEDFTNAVTSLNQLITTYAQAEIAPRGRYLRGLCYQRLEQFQPAVTDLQAFFASKPVGDELFDARYALALCQIGLKQFDPAALSLTALMKEKPDYTHADKVYYEMGHAYLAAKKPTEAITAFRTLAEKIPDSPLAAEGSFHVGRFHEAAAAELTETQQKNAELAKATLAYTAGLEKAKEGELREKLQYKLGDVLFQQEKYQEALTRLQALIKEFPQGELNGPGTFLTAESLYRLDQFTTALPLFEQVVVKKVEKFHAQALYRVGACAGNLKNWPLSQKHYSELTTQFPKFEQLSDARYGLGWAIQNQGNLPLARTTYELVTKETETEAAAKARFMIGELSFGEKKYEEAIEHFLLVAVGYPFKEWQALARFETGRCFIELGKKKKAIESLQVVVDKHPQHAKAKLATALLTDLKK